MADRLFRTWLTPRACRARLNAHLATPFLTWFSKSGVDGRTDEHGFTIWPVLTGGEHYLVRLRGRYEPSSCGTYIVCDVLLPNRGLSRTRVGTAEQEAMLSDFLMRTLETIEVTGEAPSRTGPQAG